MEPLFRKQERILFQGDSITDCGRNREDPNDLGRGFAMMAASWFSAQYPEKDVEFLNRGVGGDRTVDLLQRWEEDCLTLTPDWISLLIGINNVWRRYDRNEPTSAENFEEEYRALLERVRKESNARFILCEPFLLPVSENHIAWREDLGPKIEVVHKLAGEYEAILLPLDRIFENACKRRPAVYWSADGVHPTLPGHALIAQAWLKCVHA
jgi:acyl-CoA thioesterase-1